MNFVVLGKNIKKYRKSNRMTQENLAEKCACSVGHIAMIESAKTVPSLSMTLRIANALNITVDTLINENYVHPELKYLWELESIIEKYPKSKRIVISRALTEYIKTLEYLSKNRQWSSANLVGGH